MVQLVNFFTDQPAAAPTSPFREQIIRALVARQPAATTPIQGIANLAQTTLGAILAKREEEREAERRSGFQSTIAEAIAAGADRQIDVPNPEFNDPVVAALANRPGESLPLIEPTVTETVPGSREAALNVLAGNPDTAGIAGQIALASLFGGEDEPRRFTVGGRLLDEAGGVLFEPPAPGETTTLTAEEVEAAGFREGSVVQRKPDGTFNVAFNPPADTSLTTLTVAEKLSEGFPEDAVVQKLPNGKFSVSYKVPGGSEQSKIEVSRDQLALADSIVKEQLSELVSDTTTFGQIVLNPDRRAKIAQRVLELVTEGKSVAEITRTIRAEQGGLLTLADGTVLEEGSTFQQGDQVFVVENGQAVPFTQ